MPENYTKKISPITADYIESYKKISKFEFSINSVDVDKLFNHYELKDKRYPFLYKDKKKRIGKYFSLIKNNWSLGWQGKNTVLWTLIYKDKQKNDMTTVTFWRYTKNSWAAQHLTSTGYPECVLSMMLKAQAEGFAREYRSFHNFYSSTNPYAEQKFGDVTRSLDQNYATVYSMNYYKVKSKPKKIKNPSFIVEQITNQSTLDIVPFLKNIQGQVYVSAEELDQPDIELEDVDKIYRQYGLSRKRHFWITRDKINGAITGVIIINRAPFGFNFSLLENRSDLLISNEVTIKEKQEICCLLIAKAWEAFFTPDFPLAYPINYIQIMVNDNLKTIIKSTTLKTEFIKKYERSIWLYEAFPNWFDKIKSFLPESVKQAEIKHKEQYDKHYFLQESDSETWRLANKVDPKQFVHNYLKPLIKKGDYVLDVGAGPAVIDCELANNFPDIKVVALDNSIKRLKDAQKNIERAGLKSNISTKFGIANDLPFKANSFDFVFARFLLEYLPDSESVLKEMKRVTRKGGKIMVQDLDGQLYWHYPEDDYISSKLKVILQHLKDSSGFDPFIGRKLYHMFYQANLKQIKTKAESYHLFAGPMDKKNQKLWFTKLHNARHKIIEALNSEKKADDFIDAYMNYFKEKHTLTYSVVFTVSGVK